jgi:large subunit ribosomal protein L4
MLSIEKRVGLGTDMASIPVFNMSGNEVGSYEIDPAEIAPSINKQLLHDAVVMYQANLRRGTHKTKPRSEVRGSTKKMYRQKGTGHARAGSRRSNIRVGGGHGHTKEPRDYGFRMTKKAIRLATRMAIASKLLDGQVIVVDKLVLEGPKTKVIASMLKAFGLEGQSALIATAEIDRTVYLSGRNIERVMVSPVAELNALSVLKPKRMVVTRAALDRIKDGTFNQQPSQSAAE